jgi:hypothetical protein
MRLIGPPDEPLLASWWVGHGKPIIPAPLWPKTGYIVDECVAGFLLCTDSKFALIEWVISKPEYDRVKRRAALKQLVAVLTGTAIQLDYKMIGLLSENASLLSLLHEEGWKTDSKSLTSLYRGL